MGDIQGATLTERVVLAGILNLSTRGETPADSSDVRRAVRERLAETDADVGGVPSEADVIRAMESLRGAGLLEEISREDTSPVGKGRPRYGLEASGTELRDALASDERVAALVA